MRKIIALTGLSIALPLMAATAAAAAAQELPRWPAGAACAPGDDACPAFESEYRGRVSGVWNTLPPDIRGACVSETEPIEKSYRLLYDCLANEMQAFTKNQRRGPQGGDVVYMTPPAAGAPAMPDEARQPPRSEITPPPAEQASPPAGATPSAAQPAPPLAAQPDMPTTSAPAPR